MTSATEILRRMMDERGVEYQWTDKKHSVPSCEIVQWWSGDDVSAEYIEYHDGSTVLHIHTSMLHATPEQAIAATLGPAARHPKPHEQWTTVLLPEIAWSWDDSWPDYLSVAHDTHGEWRTYVPEATLGARSCKRVMDSIDPFAMWVCDHCGHPLDTSESFCGGCGRKVVAE